MNTLTLKGLSFNAKHGYYEEERKIGNDFEVDLTFKADLSGAAEHDDLSQTIDYQKAEAIVKEIMFGNSVKLIETLCRNIGASLFEEFEEVYELHVSVRKLKPPLETTTQYSEVSMSWQR
ncbi:MAG: dihydroneopterin aldolase [Balneolaceae bacterium]|nr:dihydroneopterin aldolase [Balneolaceae bacterium]